MSVFLTLSLCVTGEIPLYLHYYENLVCFCAIMTYKKYVFGDSDRCVCVYIYIFIYMVCVCVCVCARTLSGVRLLVTPWTAARQAPLSMGFSRQEYWSGLPFPSLRDLSNPRIESESPALQADSPLLSHWGSPLSLVDGVELS